MGSLFLFLADSVSGEASAGTFFQDLGMKPSAAKPPAKPMPSLRRFRY